MISKPRLFFYIGLATTGLVVALTFFEIKSFPDDPQLLTEVARKQMIVDRHDRPLTNSLENEWNVYEQKRLSEFSETLVRAFITAEDHQFYQHHGVDWPGRAAALWQGLRRQKITRGASTITEQVVRILHPRPRTFWSRWIETWEALRLEALWDKASILEFYLNQVPYGRQRRGVVQAARSYFARDLSSLNREEMLALAVLVRAPSSLDPVRNLAKLASRVQWLAQSMDLPVQTTNLQAPMEDYQAVNVWAPHFAEFVRQNGTVSENEHNSANERTIATTLDGSLQNFTQSILANELKNLKSKNVNHGALLAVDNQTGEVLAWAVAGGTNYNAVLVPRQPGSSLKPFLYGMALDKAWTASTLIVDEPLVTAVGTGAHAIRNYSREYYGPVTLREALGNSLNTPAIKTVQYVGSAKFLEFLRRASITSLDRSIGVYGDGIALGNAEISLYELVQAYTLFANEGHVRKLHWLQRESSTPSEALLSPEATSIISNILQDSRARRLEFGANSILNFPAPTSVKTGTATDYRDAWAVGYNARYTVGVWMGDLNRQPTAGNTGSRGPAILLRSVFNFLEQQDPRGHAMTIDSHLVARDVCRYQQQVVLKFGDCDYYTEYFIPGTEKNISAPTDLAQAGPARISFPTPQMQVAWDPRVPAQSQALEFRIDNLHHVRQVEWLVNNQRLATTQEGSVLWPLRRGLHKLSARVMKSSGELENLEDVYFRVK